jgi:hypothetical protein
MSVEEKILNGELERTYNKLLDKNQGFNDTIDLRFETAMKRCDDLQRAMDKIEFDVIRAKQQAVQEVHNAMKDFKTVSKEMYEVISGVDESKLNKIKNILEILNDMEQT